MKKIKILHVYSAMNRGGAETFIMNVFRNIDREKFQFDFLCTSNKIGCYDEEILKLGGHIYHYDSFSQKNIFKVIRDTIRILKQYGPYDCIHLPLQFYSSVFCIAAKLAKVKKIIVHSHSASDNNCNNLLRRIYFAIARKVINNFSDVRLACGKVAGKFLFGKKGKFEIVYNGINLAKYSNVDIQRVKELKNKYHLNNCLVIGHVGRFEKPKNHLFFIKIAKELAKRNIKFKIVLVGAGSLFDSFKDCAKNEKLDKYFVFTGLQTETNLYYSMFDIVVMPSLYEGFPVSIIEALICGIPCVLSDTITKEVDLIDNMCSFISLNDDIGKWCDTIMTKSTINADKNKCVAILDEKGFSIEQTVKKLSKIYASSNN